MFDEDRIHSDANLIHSLRTLGAVDLRKPGRTFGFERRPERADDTARVGPAWGHVPASRDE